MIDLTLAQMQSEAEVKTRLSSAKRQQYEAMCADTNDADILRAAIATLCDDNERLALQTQAAVAAALEGAASALQNVADNWDCGHNESRLCDCGPYVEQWGLAADEIRALITQPQHDALQAVIEKAKAEARAEDAAVRDAAAHVLHDIDDLVLSSQGVTGLHQNGDVAEWSDILEGGEFEDWLMSLETLRIVLAQIGAKP